MAETLEKKVSLTVADRRSVWLRSTFLQGSWNYERMQNGGWCYAMIPAIKRLYPEKDQQCAALKRHLEFFNTQPFVASPILGVTLALEEDRANGAPVEDQAIQGVKVRRCRRSGILVHPSSDPRCSRRFSCYLRKPPRPGPFLRALERCPYGIHVVYTGIRLFSRYGHHQGPFRRSSRQSHKGCFHPRYVHPRRPCYEMGLHQFRSQGL